MRKDSKVIGGRHFPSLNRTICHQSRGIKHKTPNEISCKGLLYKLNHEIFHGLPNTLNVLRVNKSLRDLAMFLKTDLSSWENIKSYSGT